MSERRRRVYILIAVIFASIAVLAVAGGGVAAPGIIPLAAIAGLIQDASVRKRVAAAQSETATFQP